MKAFYFGEDRKTHGTILDALNSAADSKLHLVDNGEFLPGFDATELLKEFARKQALINIEKLKPYCAPHYCPAVYYAVVVEWLETGYESWREAVVNIAGAVERTAWAADDEGAASEAAWAARSVADAAGHSSPVAAAWGAAYAAARSSREVAAARAAANDMLTDMVREATGWDV